MPNDTDKNETEDNLFQQAMSNVRPLKQNKHIQPHRHKPSPRPRQQEVDDRQVLRDMMSDPVDLSDIEIGDELLFTRNGIQHKTFKKLRRGEYAIEAELDLHGKTIEQARVTIADFLLKCQQQDLRCVRIIHGKGHGSFNKQPVLKTHVNHWLRQRDDVLAFCSCRPADGGSGALYALLRKS